MAGACGCSGIVGSYCMHFPQGMGRLWMCSYLQGPDWCSRSGFYLEKSTGMMGLEEGDSPGNEIAQGAGCSSRLLLGRSSRTHTTLTWFSWPKVEWLCLQQEDQQCQDKNVQVLMTILNSLGVMKSRVQCSSDFATELIHWSFRCLSFLTYEMGVLVSIVLKSVLWR